MFSQPKIIFRCLQAKLHEGYSRFTSAINEWINGWSENENGCCEKLLISFNGMFTMIQGFRQPLQPNTGCPRHHRQHVHILRPPRILPSICTRLNTRCYNRVSLIEMLFFIVVIKTKFLLYLQGDSICLPTSAGI